VGWNLNPQLKRTSLSPQALASPIRNNAADNIPVNRRTLRIETSHRIPEGVMRAL
jgi:hypothetical protein